ncbi:MAG: 3-carboxy-cis,cis-muconate cycloisomerase, partial [Streptomycetaceae bacterium]|nr:3-carboxy-cis,cis-muconate cycloisomerase [Streptomycetaceae bacterium]
TQHAVPTTFGLKAAGWRALVRDARKRLSDVLLPAQLGGAAGTLAAFTADAEARGVAASDDLGVRLIAAYAHATGLAESPLPWHVLRTPIADLGTALGFTAGALGKIAEDVLTLSRTEVAELAEGTRGGSSAMPHKANPVRATLIAAAARQVPPLAGVLLRALVAGDERPAGAWHAEWQPLREALRLVGGAAAAAYELAAGLRVDADRMRANTELTGGLMLTERLVAAYAPAVGRSAAREAVERVAARVARDGVELTDAIESEPALAGVLPKERLAEVTDPADYVGSAPALVARALGAKADAVASHDAATADTSDDPTRPVDGGEQS